MCYFGFLLDEGAGAGKLLGSFTLRDAFFMYGLLCLTFTLVCDVSPWGDLCGVVFCLKISINLLMACNLEAPMDANRAVGDGL